MKLPLLSKEEKNEGISGRWNANVRTSVKSDLIDALKYNKAAIYQRNRYKKDGGMMSKSLSDEYFNIANTLLLSAKIYRYSARKTT